jgi:hypothetical protein
MRLALRSIRTHQPEEREKIGAFSTGGTSSHEHVPVFASVTCCCGDHLKIFVLATGLKIVRLKGGVSANGAFRWV